MAFKIHGTMKEFKPVIGRQALEGLKLEASKKGVDLEKDVEARGFDFKADITNDKVLYFRAKMLGYDLPNGNGDAIPRIYAADFGPSFIGKHLDVNHETDVQNIIGKVVSTFHVEAALPGEPGAERIIGLNALADDDSDATRELQLEGICRIDRNTELGEIVAQKLLAGTVDGVSQEASTEYAQCSVCDHKVGSPFDTLCAHLENGSLMIKSYQVEGRKKKILAFKNHANPVGTGLAVVPTPAYDRGRVQEMQLQVAAGKMSLQAALLDLKEQAILYKKPEHIMEAIEKLQASGTTAALDSALNKLNGHETLALLEKFKTPVPVKVEADGTLRKVAREYSIESIPDLMGQNPDGIAGFEVWDTAANKLVNKFPSYEEAEDFITKQGGWVGIGPLSRKIVKAGGETDAEGREVPKLTTCQDCDGEGNAEDGKCHTCAGSGLVSEGEPGSLEAAAETDIDKDDYVFLTVLRKRDPKKFAQLTQAGGEYEEQGKQLVKWESKDVKAAENKDDVEHKGALKQVKKIEEDVEDLEEKVVDHAIRDAAERTVSAAFFRRPSPLESYWVVFGADGKVLLRTTIGALSGGDLGRSLMLKGKKTTLGRHLTTSWAEDLVAEAGRRGVKPILAELQAAEQAWGLKLKASEDNSADASYFFTVWTRPEDGKGDYTRTEFSTKAEAFKAQDDYIAQNPKGETMLRTRWKADGPLNAEPAVVKAARPSQGARLEGRKVKAKQTIKADLPSSAIQSQGWDGMYVLMHEDGGYAQRGEELTDFRGDKAYLVGGRAPHKSSSQGKVWTKDKKDDDSFGNSELYASVYNLKWVKLPEGGGPPQEGEDPAAPSTVEDLLRKPAAPEGTRNRGPRSMATASLTADQKCSICKESLADTSEEGFKKHVQEVHKDYPLRKLRPEEKLGDLKPMGAKKFRDLPIKAGESKWVDRSTETEEIYEFRAPAGNGIGQVRQYAPEYENGKKVTWSDQWSWSIRRGPQQASGKARSLKDAKAIVEDPNGPAAKLAIRSAKLKAADDDIEELFVGDVVQIEYYPRNEDEGDAYEGPATVTDKAQSRYSDDIEYKFSMPGSDDDDILFTLDDVVSLITPSPKRGTARKMKLPDLDPDKLNPEDGWDEVAKLNISVDEVDEYSGRGMYGEVSPFAFTVESLSDQADQKLTEWGLRRDSLGRKTIYYMEAPPRKRKAPKIQGARRFRDLPEVVAPSPAVNNQPKTLDPAVHPQGGSNRPV